MRLDSHRLPPPARGLCLWLFVAALLHTAWAQSSPEADELFVSSAPENLVTLTFSMGFDTTEHYSDYQTQIAGAGDTPFSALGASDLVGSTLLGSVTGSAFADHGTLRSMIEITPQDTSLYTATSTAAFTDTITVFAPGLEGQSGTLHLEYAIDGRATGTASNFAAALSLTLIGEDSFALTEPFSQSFGTLGSAFDVTITPESPLTTTLDMAIVFGEETTYGASLGLTLIGEGKLDFSDTVSFTGAKVTNANQEVIASAFIDSRAGIVYGNHKAIPEPSASGLMLLALLGFMINASRHRRHSHFPRCSRSAGEFL